MKLKVERRWKKDSYTIGRLYVNGVFFCNTLEDVDRHLDDSMPESMIKVQKKYGITAIPTGTYTIDMNTVSPKFKDRSWARPFGGKLPRLLNVKGFEGVLIHVLNTPEQSLGCLGVGDNTIKGQLTNSTKRFTDLMSIHLVPAYRRGERITIEIV